MKDYQFESNTTKLLVSWYQNNLSQGTNFADYLWNNLIKTEKPDLELVKFLFNYAEISRKETGRKYPDLFGDFMCWSKSKMSKDGLGQFLTPFSVADLMAKISIPTIPKKLMYLDEPSCGSGRNVLAVYEHLNTFGFSAQNVFYTCTDLDFEAFIYMLMNVFIHQIPNVLVICGDTLLSTPESLRFAVGTYLTKEGYVEWQECRDLALQLPQWKNKIAK